MLRCLWYEDPGESEHDFKQKSVQTLGFGVQETNQQEMWLQEENGRCCVCFGREFLSVVYEITSFVLLVTPRLAL